MAHSDLQGLGLTRSRVIALQALARAVAEEGMALDRETDQEQAITRLLQIPGIGPWTTSYVAMRSLRDPDAFPVTDLGLRRAFEQLGTTFQYDQYRKTRRSMASLACLWCPLPLGKSRRPSYFLLTTTPFSRTVISVVRT